MFLRRLLKEYVKGQKWTIGFCEQPIKDILEGQSLKINYLKDQPSDRWFADPFILDYNAETITVLVEEYLYKTRLGRIARLTIDRETYSIIDNELVLELNSHLSFPAIWRENNSIYIYPENANGLGLALYEYEQSSNKCKYVKTITPEPLADAIITDLFGDRLLFSTLIPTHNGNTLSVYYYQDEQIKKRCDFEFPSNIARNAGSWFKVDNDIYRPAQDCNAGYGKAVLLQKVAIKDGAFIFDTKRCIESPHSKFNTGCHTFNFYRGMTVLDFHGYRHKVAAELYKGITSFI